jgi:hypothetical protein
VHSARWEHYGGGLAACSGKMVVVHWVEVFVAKASASGSSGVVLETLVAVSKSKGVALALASAAGSSVVA